jgi:hypothetical protein
MALAPRSTLPTGTRCCTTAGHAATSRATVVGFGRAATLAARTS